MLALAGLGVSLACRAAATRCSAAAPAGEGRHARPSAHHPSDAGPLIQAAPAHDDREALRGLRKGSTVVFRDGKGQIAVVQPWGNGREHRLEPSCTGVRFIPWFYDRQTLYSVPADSMFVVDRQGNEFAFHAVGAEGACVMAQRDASAPHVLARPTGSSGKAKWWRLHGARFINAQHDHKALGWSVVEVCSIPLESLQATAEQFEADREALRTEVAELQCEADAAKQRHVSDVAASSRQHEVQVQELQWQLQQATRACREQEAKAASSACRADEMRQQLAVLEAQSKRLDAEVLAANARLAAVQKEMFSLQDHHLDEKRQMSEDMHRQLEGLRKQRDAEVANLLRQLESFKRSLDCGSTTSAWVKDQSSALWGQEMLQKDAAIEDLKQQKQRLEYAFQTIQQQLRYLEPHTTPVDRASLDAVSLQELQDFMRTPASCNRSAMRSSVHLLRLLEPDLEPSSAPHAAAGAAVVAPPASGVETPQASRRPQQLLQVKHTASFGSHAGSMTRSLQLQPDQPTGGPVLAGLSCSAGALPREAPGPTMHTPSGVKDMSLLRLAAQPMAGGGGSCSTSRASSMSEGPRAGVPAAAGAGGQEAGGSPAALQALRERMNHRASPLGLPAGAGTSASSSARSSKHSLQDKSPGASLGSLTARLAPEGAAIAPAAAAATAEAAAAWPLAGGAGAAAGARHASSSNASSASLAGSGEMTMAPPCSSSGGGRTRTLGDMPSHRYECLLSAEEGSEAAEDDGCSTDGGHGALAADCVRVASTGDGVQIHMID